MIESSTEEGRNKYKTDKNDIKVSKYCLTLQAPIPQNGEAHSNSHRIVWVCLTVSLGWGLKR